MEEAKFAGSKITKFSGYKNPNFSGKLEINTQIKLESPEKLKNLKNITKIPYSFKINYKDLGDVNVEGLIFLEASNKFIKSLQKSTKEKKFNTPEQTLITNLILQKASIKALSIGEELGLPPHIRLPSINFKE